MHPGKLDTAVTDTGMLQVHCIVQMVLPTTRKDHIVG